MVDDVLRKELMPEKRVKVELLPTMMPAPTQAAVVGFIFLS